MTATTTGTAESPDTTAIGELRVRRLGYGALHLTGPSFWGPPPDPEAAVSTVRRAVELGVDLIDTADSYGPQESERLVCEALHPYDGVTVATKVGLLRPDPREPRDWPPCGRPDYLRQQAHLSMRRLRVDCLDVLYLHRIDPTVARDDQFGVLAELRREGKVREVGLSEVSVEEIEAARRLVPIAIVQNRYNVGERASDPVLDYCTAEGIAFAAWYPLDNGRLARAWGPAVDAVAAAAGATPAQLALAWLLHRSPRMIALPGSADVAEVEENVAAARIRLSDEQSQRLEA